MFLRMLSKMLTWCSNVWQNNLKLACLRSWKRKAPRGAAQHSPECSGVAPKCSLEWWNTAQRSAVFRRTHCFQVDTRVVALDLAHST
jgi:hypothetical protein